MNAELTDALKSALVKAATQEVMALLVSRFAFLALPMVSPLVSWFVGYVMEVFMKETDIGVAFIVNGIRVEHQAKVFEDAVENTKKASTDAEKAIAEKAEMDAAAALIKWTA